MNTQTARRARVASARPRPAKRKIPLSSGDIVTTVVCIIFALGMAVGYSAGHSAGVNDGVHLVTDQADYLP